MSRFSRPIGCLLLSVVLVAPSVIAPSTAGADEVVFKDGTRILGRITSLSGGTLTIAEGSAGKVEVPFANVMTLATDESHTAVFTDGSVRRGRFLVSPGEDPQFVTDRGPQPFELAEITAIDPPKVKPVRYDGNITLSAKATEGNTKTETLASFAEVIRRTEKGRLTVFGAWNYSEEGGQVSQRNAQGRGKYDYFFTDRLFAYGNGSLEGDEFADLDLRTTVGAGGGYQFYDRPDLKFYEELGASYIDEDFDGGVSDERASSRISGKVDWVVVAHRITLFHFHEVFWSLENVDDMQVETRTGLRFTLIANFFASLQLNFKWDNTPAAGKDRTDSEYLLGLGYAFSF